MSDKEGHIAQVISPDGTETFLAIPAGFVFHTGGEIDDTIFVPVMGPNGPVSMMVNLQNVELEAERQRAARRLVEERETALFRQELELEKRRRELEKRERREAAVNPKFARYLAERKAAGGG